MTTLMVTAGLMSGAIAAPEPTTAQSPDGPGELWDAYPLEEREADPVPTPTSAAPRPVRAPAAVEGDETAAGWSLGVLLAGALAAFGVGVLLPLLRRDGPPPPAAEPPARRVRYRRFAPSSEGDRQPSRFGSDSRRE
jgi:hypothetical protein